MESQWRQRHTTRSRRKLFAIGVFRGASLPWETDTCSKLFAYSFSASESVCFAVDFETSLKQYFYINSFCEARAVRARPESAKQGFDAMNLYEPVRSIVNVISFPQLTSLVLQVLSPAAARHHGCTASSHSTWRAPGSCDTCVCAPGNPRARTRRRPTRWRGRMPHRRRNDPD